jgi:hypothetical protein
MGIANLIANWLNLIAIFFALRISIFNKHRSDLFPIKLYIIVSLIANLILNIFDAFVLNDPWKSIEQITFNIYSLLEISLLYYFIYAKIKGVWLRRSLLIFYIIFFSICIAGWSLNKKVIYSFMPEISGFEGILITISCFFYIYELLKSDLIINLKSNSNFIVTCGMLFYFSISVPIYFSWYNLHYLTPSIKEIFVLLNSILYTILFVSFMKAYLCPISDSK